MPHIHGGFIVKSRLVASLAGLSVAVAAPLVLTSPASAAPLYMNVCNSKYSTTTITVHDSERSWVVTFGPTVCVWRYNGDGKLRVEVPGESYRIAYLNTGYGACHNGPYLSNPANGSKATYKTYRKDNCRN